MPNPTLPVKLSLPTLVGLGLSLLVPLLYGLVLGPVLIKPNVDPILYVLSGFGVSWLATLGVVLITVYWERQPLTSLGLQGLSWKWGLIAFGLGNVLAISVPLLTALASLLIPPTEAGSITSNAAQTPVWLLLIGVITAGVTEEVLFRAYPLERLLALTQRPWLSAFISVFLFVIAHGRGWNLTHLVGVVLPLGVVLTGLYFWRRNLPFNIIIHTIIDLPLVVIAGLAQTAGR